MNKNWLWRCKRQVSMRCGGHIYSERLSSPHTDRNEKKIQSSILFILLFSCCGCGWKEERSDFRSIVFICYPVQRNQHTLARASGQSMSAEIHIEYYSVDWGTIIRLIQMERQPLIHTYEDNQNNKSHWGERKLADTSCRLHDWVRSEAHRSNIYISLYIPELSITEAMFLL